MSNQLETLSETLSENGKAVKSMIEQTNGKFFTILFTKADGTKRKLLGRTGVKKGVKGTGLPNTKEHIVRVWDTQIGQFRSINVESVEHLSCGKLQYHTNN